MPFKAKTNINGYPIIKIPEHHRANSVGYVYTHIIIAEIKYKRKIINGEVIHHIDHNRKNYKPENLVLLPNQRAHLLYEKIQRLLS